MLKNHKYSLIILGIIIVTAIVLRILTPEDNWICQNGTWQKHGNPSKAQPREVCSGAVPALIQSNNPASSIVISQTPTSTSISESASTSTSVIEPKVVKPQANDLIGSPYEVNGLAPGNWFFEASLPVRLFDLNNQLIIATSARALSDWMTTELVPFSANLIFKTQATSGYIIIAKDNPSDLPQNAGTYKIPVRFK